MTRLTRRELLAAGGSAGGIGVAGGLVSASFLRDLELTTGNLLRAGALDLQIDCEAGACVVGPDGTVALAIEGLEPGDAGEERLHLDLVGNPAWLWLGATCPTGRLADALELTVTFHRRCDAPGTLVAEGTLRAVVDLLRAGVRLADTCITSSDDPCLVVAWHFPDLPGSNRYAGETVGFQLRFGALQCRHRDGTVNPVPGDPCEGDGGGISFIEVWGCLPVDAPDCTCTLLGKLELDDAYAGGCGDVLDTDGISENHIVPGVYDLPVDDDCEDTGWDLEVTATTENAEGETTGVAFAVLDGAGDPGPVLCKVVLKGGPDEVVYEADDLGDPSNDTGGLLTLEGPA